MAVLVLGAIGSTFMYTERAMRARSRPASRRSTRPTPTPHAGSSRPTRCAPSRPRSCAPPELAATLLEKVPRSNLLAEFTNSLPPGVSLIDLALESRERAAPPQRAQTAFEQKKAALEGRAPPPPPPRRRPRRTT